MQYKEWIIIPKPIPNEVNIAILLPYKKLCLLIKIKSGPGLTTARKWAKATKKNWLLSKICINEKSENFVPRAGIEPARTYKVRGILSPLCLPISPPRHYWGVDQNRTGEWQFCRLLPYHLGTTPTFKKARPHKEAFWAKDGIRTHDPHVGNVMLYQLSYFRKFN